MLDREALGRKIVQVASDHAAGYERNISDCKSEHENDVARKCAIAASNTGYFLLKALGYSEEEIKSFRLSNDRQPAHKDDVR